MPKVPDENSVSRNGVDLAVDDVDGALGDAPAVRSLEEERVSIVDLAGPALGLHFVYQTFRQRGCLIHVRMEGKRIRFGFARQMQHGLTKTARNRGECWLTCSWKMVRC